MGNRFRKISIVLFCTYIAAVILLCLIKTDNFPELPKIFLGIPLDKLTHFIMFFPYTILGYCSFHPADAVFWRKAAVVAVILVTGGTLAFSTERLQAMTSYRSFEIMDMAADGCGLAAGAVLTLIYIATTRK